MELDFKCSFSAVYFPTILLCFAVVYSLPLRPSSSSAQLRVHVRRPGVVALESVGYPGTFLAVKGGQATTGAGGKFCDFAIEEVGMKTTPLPTLSPVTPPYSTPLQTTVSTCAWSQFSFRGISLEFFPTVP